MKWSLHQKAEHEIWTFNDWAKIILIKFLKFDLQSFTQDLGILFELHQFNLLGEPKPGPITEQQTPLNVITFGQY